MYRGVCVHVCVFGKKRKRGKEKKEPEKDQAGTHWLLLGNYLNCRNEDRKKSMFSFCIKL